MHGRRANNSKDEDLKLEKVKELIPVMNDLIKKKRRNTYEKEYIETTSIILKKCPYIQTLWNYRREYFESIKNDYIKENKENKENSISEKEDDRKDFLKKNLDELRKIIKNENIMVEDILKKFNKCNELWFHKLWLIKYSLKNNLINVTDLLNELEYCKNSFLKDDRNYHCWNYRSYIISCINISHRKLEYEEKENDDSKKVNSDFNVYKANYELSKELIELNFSNFSAWFLKYSLKESLIDTKEELYLIKNAIFTDPFDQSLWEFYRWFLFQNGNYEEEIFFVLLNNDCFYFFFHNLIKVNLSKCKCYNSKHNEINGIWDKQIITINNSSNNSESYIYFFKVNKDVNLSEIRYLKFFIYYFKYNIYNPDKINYEKNILQDLIIGHDYLNEENKFEYVINYEIDFQKFSKNNNFKILLDYNKKNLLNNEIFRQVDHRNKYFNLYKYINCSSIVLNLGKFTDFNLLYSELEQINELLNLENKCKFALITKFEILRRLEKFKETFEVLEMLKEVDYTRIEYYKEMELELKIKKRIHDYYYDLELEHNNKILDLSSLDIKDLIYPQMIEAFFISKINLSRNLLSESYTGKFALNFLYNLKELYLDNNQIKNFTVLMMNLYNLKFLEKLDVSNNTLININEDLDKYEFIILPLLKYININNSNLSILLNDKYKDKNKINTYDIIRDNGNIILSKI
ncbi:protein prenyltransferase alpha subunit, putative [Plasmodium gallinaceum]|uniref:Geranylgeranyl transferase type-2 subunit alpha n=1 Tax=Plasmodium gallinaceum TaxID=5849 RepID=A0A1J1GQT0_PLAGA|nr:protein prenyltransferase alpha subunit, putative [Plasmodium gallinaceum]CRG94620.1 protein prenyltransferase alpha subunit, putative [Plasmodium gallinaceum]